MEQRPTAEPAPAVPVAIDRGQLRQAFGAFATGVAVLTVGGPRPHGMTANSLTSVSLDPPLLLVCVEHTAVMHACLDRSPAFGVSVLGAEQEPLARYFADSRRPLGAAQFDQVAWRPGPATGVPLIAGALAWFECERWRRYEGGDHSIFVGRLVLVGCGPGEDGLLFHRGRFHRTDRGGRQP